MTDAQNPRAVGDKACACAKCVDLCRRNPGWFTPQEAAKALAAGLADKLMCDWLEPSNEVGNDERIFVLAPAADARGGEMAPEWDEMHGGGGGMFAALLGPLPYKGRCIFFKKDRCAVHDSGFKPRQCVENFGCDGQIRADNYEMARLWNNEEGRALIATWREKVDCPAEENVE